MSDWTLGHLTPSILRAAAMSDRNLPICSSQQQKKNRVHAHSFLDKDFNSVYLLCVRFFHVVAFAFTAIARQGNQSVEPTVSI